MAYDSPERVRALHVNSPSVLPFPADLSDLSEAEQAWLAEAAKWRTRGAHYMLTQATAPDTLAPAPERLAGRPRGVARLEVPRLVGLRRRRRDALHARPALRLPHALLGDGHDLDLDPPVCGRGSRSLEARGGGEDRRSSRGRRLSRGDPPPAARMGRADARRPAPVDRIRPRRPFRRLGGAGASGSRHRRLPARGVMERLFAALDLPDDSPRRARGLGRSRAHRSRASASAGRDPSHDALLSRLDAAERVEEAKAVIEAVKPRQVPIRLHSAPRRKAAAQAIALRHRGGGAEAISLAEEVALGTASCGLAEEEKRPFWPHVTVARVRSEKGGGGPRRRRPLRVERPPEPTPGRTGGRVRCRPTLSLPFDDAARWLSVRAALQLELEVKEKNGRTDEGRSEGGGEGSEGPHGSARRRHDPDRQGVRRRHAHDPERTTTR